MIFGIYSHFHLVWALVPKRINVIIYQTLSQNSSVLQRPKVYTKSLRLNTSRKFPWKDYDPFDPIPINNNLFRCMESICSAILPSSLVLFLKSVLPNCHIHITIWLNWLFAKLTLFLCQIVKSTLPNCEVHVVTFIMASFPHCQLCIKCYLALKPVDYLNAFQDAH
jgi:hypothetical protein